MYTGHQAWETILNFLALFQRHPVSDGTCLPDDTIVSSSTKFPFAVWKRPDCRVVSFAHALHYSALGLVRMCLNNGCRKRSDQIEISMKRRGIFISPAENRAA